MKCELWTCDRNTQTMNNIAVKNYQQIILALLYLIKIALKFNSNLKIQLAKHHEIKKEHLHS